MKLDLKRLITGVLLTGAMVLSLLSAGTTVTTMAADEKEELDVTKSVTWDYNDPTTAKVTITSDVPEVENTKVLFLGTLCAAHSLTKDTLIASINAIAQNAEVKYHLLNTTTEAASGTVEYGKTMTTAQQSAFSIKDSGNHAALAQFISVLTSELGTDPTVFNYDYIVLEFDSSRLGDGAATSDVTDLAKVLKEYYKNDKVIWVTDGFDGNTSASTKTYGTTKYTPTNVYYTNKDGTKKYLKAAEFRMLCSILAPSYYLTNTDADTAHYGTGGGNTSGSEFTLSDDYSLTVGYKTTEGLYAGHYADDSRQMYYSSASELSDFLYMAIKGVTLQFNDRIKVSDKDTVKVAKVTLYATSDNVASAASATNWTTICELNVASATLETGEDGIKYAQASSANGLIKVTTGNIGTNISKNNLVTVNAIDMKNTIKFVKLVIEMTDSDGFKSCITVKVDEKGNQVLDADGKLQFVMNPNDGPAEVAAYSNGTSVSGESIAEGDGVAAAAGVNTRVITSEVTGGTKSQSGGAVKTGEESNNPQSIYSYDGQTVSTTYTPNTGYQLKSITIDGSAVTLDESGAATGTGYTVSTNATTGAITVTFADLSADHAVEVVFEKEQIKVTYSYPEDATKPDGATAPDEDSIDKGSEYDADSVTDVDGYHFEGWYTSYNKGVFSNAYENGTTLNENTALYGKWTYAISVEKALTKPTIGTIQGGDEIEYTITIKNDSDATVTGYTVTDALDSNLAYKSGATNSTTGTVTEASGTVTATPLTIPANGSATVTITATVNKELTATAGTKIANTAVGKDSKDKETTSEPEEFTAYPRTIEVEYKYVGTVTPNGATVPAGKTDLEYGATYTASEGSSTALTNPKWFTFSGWHKDENLTTDYDSSEALTAENYSALATTDKVTLYGSWEPVSGYTVTKSVKYDGESVAAEKVYSNHTVTYYIDVKNNNPECSMTTTVVDEIPSGLDLVEDSISNKGSYASGKIAWTLEVPAGETITVNFNATVSATLGEITDFTNKAYITKSNGETYDGPGDEDNPATVVFKGVPVKALTFTKAWSDEWNNHETESVSINVYANGTKQETVKLTKDEPGKTIYVDAVDAAGTEIAYTYKEVDFGDSSKDVSRDGINGLYKFTFTETSDDETETANATINVVNEYQIRTRDLDFNKTADATAEAGKPLTYTLTVKNTREYETAKNIVVEDVLPEGLTVDLINSTFAETDILEQDPDNAQKIIWTIDSIEPGKTAELKLVVNIPEEATAEEYINTGSITSIGGTTCEDPKESPEAKTTLRNFTVNKVWLGSDGEPVDVTTDLPAVNVKLYQNGDEYDDVQLTNANKWTYTWEVLPLCDEDGVPYAYTVSEEAVDGYTGAIEYSADAKSEKYGDTAADIKNTLKTVTVKYAFVGDDQPEGATAPATETLDYGTKYDSAEKPATTEAPFKYYTFDGWFTDETCKTSYTDGTVLNDTSAPDGLLTLFGKWTRKTVKVTIVEPEDGPKVEYEDPWTVNQGEKVDPEDIEAPEGYIFEGYYTDPDFENKFENPVLDDDNTNDGELKLYPKWTKKVSVTYKFTGSIPQGINVPEGTLLAPGTKYTATKEDGSAENYVFEGWFTDEACTKKFVDDTEIKEDTVLYGKWTYVTPNTGDSHNMALWICLAGLALLTCIGGTLKIKSEKR